MLATVTSCIFKIALNDYLSDFSLSGKGLKLYHLNVCSLLSKIDELRITNGISNNEASVVCFSDLKMIIFQILVFLVKDLNFTT